MKTIVVLLVLVTGWWCVSDTCVAGCRDEEQITKEARELAQAAERFHQLMEAGTGSGSFQRSSQIGDNALMLSKQARTLLTSTEAGADCQVVKKNFSEFKKNYIDINRSLKVSQSSMYRSDILKQWRRVKHVYNRLNPLIQKTQ